MKLRWKVKKRLNHWQDKEEKGKLYKTPKGISLYARLNNVIKNQGKYKTKIES